jgi:hypothetical protein|eukprot:scaffold1179_cov118-Isochrysis_galbana.AAC.11
MVVSSAPSTTPAPADIQPAQTGDARLHPVSLVVLISGGVAHPDAFQGHVLLADAASEYDC